MRNLILNFLIITFACCFLQAQEKEAAWIAYEKGMRELTARNYGQAVYYLKKALSQAKMMPEAEIALGDVYFYQGDYAIAEKQYLKAWQDRLAFNIPELKYQALYRLASLYQFQKKYGKFEEVLRQIVAEDEMFSDKTNKFFKDNLKKLFEKKGFDETFKLNRLDESFATDAYAQLAWFYYISYRFEYALDYALFSVIPLLSEAMKEIRHNNPFYQYNNLTDFFKQALKDTALKAYLERRGLYKRLYYLALICYELVKLRDIGIYLLKELSALIEAGEYQRKAKQQLLKPFREKSLEVEMSENQLF